MVAVIVINKRVVILDMCEFVGDHAGELLARERLDETGGHRNRRVLRIASGGKGVRLRIIHQEDARHRQAGAPGEFADETDKLGRGMAVDLMGAVHRQHHAVRVPVGEQIGRRRDHERDNRASGAADQIADAHEQASEAGQQNCGFKIVHRRSPCCRGRAGAADASQVGINPAALQDTALRRGAAAYGALAQQRSRCGLASQAITRHNKAPGDARGSSLSVGIGRAVFST